MPTKESSTTIENALPGNVVSFPKREYEVDFEYEDDNERERMETMLNIINYPELKILTNEEIESVINMVFLRRHAIAQEGGVDNDAD